MSRINPNKNDDEYSTLVKRIEELQYIIENSQSKPQTKPLYVRPGLVGNSKKQCSVNTFLPEMMTVASSACMPQPAASDFSNDVVKNKKMTYVSTLSPKKSLTGMANASEINIRLKETEEKIKQLKQTMSIMKHKSNSGNIKPKIVKSNTVPSMTSVVAGKSCSQQTSTSLAQKNKDCSMPVTSAAGMKLKSHSITPISDLIASNLSSQQSSYKANHSSHQNIGSKSTAKSNYLKMQSKFNVGVQRKGSSNVSVKSITPITDLVDQNLAQLRMSSNSANLTSLPVKIIPSTSITPISDLITKTMQGKNLKSKQNYRNSFDKLKIRRSQFKSTRWHRNDTISKLKPRRYENSINKIPAFSLQTKWCKNRTYSYQDCRPTKFKSPTQRIANVIKNKYRFVKESPTDQKFRLNHISSAYDFNKWKEYRSKKQLSFKAIKFGSTRNYKTKQKWSSRASFKLDRRKQPVFSSPSILDGQRLVMVHGTVYRTSAQGLISTRTLRQTYRRNSNILKKIQSSTSKTILVRGVKFQMAANGKTLRRLRSLDNHVGKKVSRVDIGGVVYVQKTDYVLEKLNTNSRTVASQVLQKSIRLAAARFKKDNTKLAKQFCKFYNRFGHCKRGNTCQYIHDPSKIAICTRFLRGTCSIKDCPFSHKVDKDKMPVCSYYLRGICNRDECPYIHVNVDRNADICVDFLNGFCPLGVKCKKKHTRSFQKKRSPKKKKQLPKQKKNILISKENNKVHNENKDKATVLSYKMPEIPVRTPPRYYTDER